MIYQFGSHIQYLVGELAASTAFVCCNAIFATKAFNFDCPHTIYITTEVITIVINAAMKRSTFTMQLSRNDPNLELTLASSISFWSCVSVISFLYLYWVRKLFIVCGAVSTFGSNSKFSIEIGRISSVLSSLLIQKSLSSL